MAANVTRLLPAPSADMPLRGLYLEEAIHRERRRERAFIYTNFISSLDGRIAVGTDGSHPSGVPAALANARDWRLYQELTIQADVIITSGRYLREFASGDAGPVFTFDRDPDLADLREWRSTAGLAEEPALAVVSRQLDFDWKAARRQSPAVIGIGSSDADAAVVSRLENEGIAVVLGSSRSGVTGSEIAEGLAALGHHTAFSSAGPHIAHLLFADNVLDRLYVTYVTTILGGRSYATLSEGAGLDSPFAMEPRSLYFDPAGANGGAQIFSSFDQR